ncbi:GtrA family protein [Streptomyces sp. DSM 44915]|uniref:GtrA family protein n=1 Tax=Streptomyces chisholmiae TaxID=3075540 RepID=A0ABU2JZQ5_9ACTN|nr:GtrA family protein [Streptomyces sp. DSM 44915]MDT0270422.1 GtrA family protein [Streptomyces sp. DSM 44915]
MSEEHPLRARLRGVAREAAKFGTVGAFGFLVNVLVFNLCSQVAGLAPIRSGVLATSAAICTNYLGNSYWTYRHRDRSGRRREIALFVLFSAVGMIIENGVLALSHYGLGLTSALADNLAKNVVGLGIGSLFRFWSYRTWVFRRVAAAPAAPADRRASSGARPETFREAGRTGGRRPGALPLGQGRR